MDIEISPRVICRGFLYFVLFLVVANVAGIISKFYLGHEYAHGLVPLFDFNTEANVPTFYSAMALLLACVILAFIANHHRKMNAPYLSWLGLSVVFLYLSIDEISFLHEKTALSSRALINGTGFLFYAWIVPYGLAVLVFAIGYLKFLLHLPKKIMVLFITAGTVFVAGAIGMESIGGQEIEFRPDNNVLYAIYYTIEEFLEMLGIIIFIYALLTYINDTFKSLTIIITEQSNTERGMS